VALNTTAATDSGYDQQPQLETDGGGTWVAVWESDDSLGGTIGSDSDILVARFAFPDCNGNGVGDGEDIRVGTSADSDGDKVPNECDVCPVPGFDGVDCELGELVRVPLCDALDPKLARVTAKLVKKARARLGKARKFGAATARKQVRKLNGLLTRVDRKLAAIAKAAGRALAKDKITDGCQATIEERIATRHELLVALRR